jgi:phosphoglucomutase
MYEKYGYYKDGIQAITLAGIEGLQKIQDVLNTLRNETPEKFGRYKVISARDYKKGTITDIVTGEVKPTNLPESNVLYYDLEDGAWMCVRPSGTEPKIKFYYGIKGSSLEDADKLEKELGEEVIKLINDMIG